jgi:hypothetical protein
LRRGSRAHHQREQRQRPQQAAGLHGASHAARRRWQRLGALALSEPGWASMTLQQRLRQQCLQLCSCMQPCSAVLLQQVYSTLPAAPQRGQLKHLHQR